MAFSSSSSLLATDAIESGVEWLQPLTPRTHAFRPLSRQVLLLCNIVSLMRALVRIGDIKVVPAEPPGRAEGTLDAVLGQFRPMLASAATGVFFRSRWWKRRR